MTATLASLRALGLHARLDENGGLKVGPANLITPELAAQIREGKPALLAELRQEQAEDVAEFIAERAAIMQHDGGLPRHEAERLAIQRASVHFALADTHGDPPRHDEGFLLGEPGDTQESLLAELKARYGDRLLTAHAQTEPDRRQTELSETL